MTLNSNEIQKIIPHRYPFLLIDQATIIDEKNIRGIKNVTVNEPFFQGHFPQEHVMPGVLIVESMAQLGAVLLLNQEEYRGKIAYFAGIKKCKFRRKVVPGDSLSLQVELIKARIGYGLALAKAFVGDELACEAEIAFAIEV